MPAVFDVATIVVRLVRARIGGDTTAGTMTLVVDNAARVLLVRPSYRRRWCLPGGFLEPGEDTVAGAAREVLEETGYSLQYPPRTIATRQRRAHIDHLLIGTADKLHAGAPSTAWEIGATAWIPVGDVPQLHPICQTMLDAYGGIAHLVREETLAMLRVGGADAKD